MRMLEQKPEIETKSYVCETFEERPVFYEANIATIIGYLLVMFAAVFFLTGVYCLFGEYLIESTGNYVLDSIKDDSWYCYLAPLLLVSSGWIRFINFTAHKFVKHS